MTLFGTIGRCTVCAAVLGFLVLPEAAQGQTQPVRTRHIRTAVSSGEAALVGRLPGNQVLRLTIALPLRDEPSLDQFLQLLYDRRSSLYHQFLSVQEFTERFGPSEGDYQSVVDYARTNGFTV